MKDRVCRRRVGVAAAHAVRTTRYDVVYNVFSGFLAPLAKPKDQKAGSTIPVKFRLDTDFGLGILPAGYPQSRPVSCSTGAPLGPATPTSSDTGLTFQIDHYEYAWKTNTTWSGTCRELIVKLDDNTVHTATISFK